MMVAARSSSECAASDRIASEPVASPTAALASVSPPEEGIDVSATRCLMSCMSRLCDRRRSEGERGRQQRGGANCSIGAQIGVFALGLRFTSQEQTLKNQNVAPGPRGVRGRQHSRRNVDASLADLLASYAGPSRKRAYV